MADSVYHEGQRRLQDQFDCRRIADRLEERTYSDALSPGDAGFIASCAMFFLATADAEGRPDVSYKGGAPGFVRALDPHTLAWADYDGNGQFRSLGNTLVNPHVQLLFIDFEQPDRLRVAGTATVSADDPLLASWPGGQLVVRVHVTRVFPNCPRYVHRMAMVEPSRYVPAAGVEAPVPDWKRDDEFRDWLPGAKPKR
jgi:predicted pyridoxine 5'-phosphate oxidase superfamily flavin-nucleotide-binding protein